MPDTKQVLGSYVLSNEDEGMVATQWGQCLPRTWETSSGKHRQHAAEHSIPISFPAYATATNSCVQESSIAPMGLWQEMMVQALRNGRHSWCCCSRGLPKDLKARSSCLQTLSVSPHSTQVPPKQAHKTPGDANLETIQREETEMTYIWVSPRLKTPKTKSIYKFPRKLFEFYIKSMGTYESCVLLYGLIHTEHTVEETETRESLYL